jgi:hypothetical protein
MLPPDVSNYWREIARVLKTGGVCLITWFVLNQESLALNAAGKSLRSFPHDCGDYRSMDEKTAELAVAYRDEYIARMYAERGLQIQPPIRYGSWCGREQFLSYQDIVIADKSR